MFKKKLVTIVAAAFCVAIVTAQQSVVYRTTGGLIEDGAIDSLKFGTEDGSGVVFGQYLNDESITLGWGNSLSDTLWLSVYDAWKYKASNEGTKATAVNNAQADDTINVDYTATTRKQSGKNSTHIANDLGVGVGINNTLGFQLVWGADYLMYKNPVVNATNAGVITWGTAAITEDNGNEREIKSEENDPGNGTNTKKEWTKYSNNNIDNNFVVNFKGVGVEDIGDIAFFVKLNKVYFNWNSINRTGDYTETESKNGKTTSETTITGKNTENTLTPGLNFDLGLNILDNDVSTVKFVYEDDFSMTFKPRTNESTKTVKAFGTANETTETNSYKVNYGKYLKWSNKFEPKLVAEFKVAEPLQLKAQLSLPVTLTQEIDDADTYESVAQKETFVRKNAYSYRAAAADNKKTTTGEREDWNTDKFTTKFSPSLAAGFVYEVTPGKFNVNFGAGVTPNYTWTTTTKVNANINTVTVTETKDEAGNSNTSKTVTVANNGNTETKETTVTTSIGAGAALGATWFFTENVSFDVYFNGQFGANIFQTAGASVTVKF